MSIDRVRPLKIETLADGSTIDFGPTEVNDLDYLAAKGVSFENSDTEIMDLSSDINVQTLSFASAIMTKRVVPDDTKNYVLSTDHQMMMFDYLRLEGVLTLNLDSELVLFD